MGLPLSDRLASPRGVGHRLLDLVEKQHADVSSFVGAVGLDQPSADLPDGHATLVDHLDDRSLGSLAAGDESGCRSDPGEELGLCLGTTGECLGEMGDDRVALSFAGPMAFVG